MILKKQELAINCYDAALARIDELYDRFDKVVVSFSGGKDSTSALNLTITVATLRRRLPVDCYFFDEEAIHPETIDYVRRVHQRDDVRLRWLCVPIRHRNACSRKQPWWYPWSPEDEAKWVRPFPVEGARTVPFFQHGDTMPESVCGLYGPEYGSVVHIRGLRADESMNRYRAVARSEHDNWLAGPPIADNPATRAPTKHVTMASPIYDWRVGDVWKATADNGWDYNRTYDVFDKAGVPAVAQRVCPPYGEEPLRGLHQYAECWPALWHKMIHRVEGAATAARYARTELYGFGGIQLPTGKTWQSWFWDLLKMNRAEERAFISNAVSTVIKKHLASVGRPVPEDSPDPITGLSWRKLCIIVIRGDLKGRRIGNIIPADTSAYKARQEQLGKLNVTDEIDLDTYVEGTDESTRY